MNRFIGGRQQSRITMGIYALPCLVSEAVFGPPKVYKQRPTNGTHSVPVSVRCRFTQSECSEPSIQFVIMFDNAISQGAPELLQVYVEETRPVQLSNVWLIFACCSPDLVVQGEHPKSKAKWILNDRNHTSRRNLRDRIPVNTRLSLSGFRLMRLVA